MYKRIYDSEEIVVDYYNDGKPMIRVSQFEDYHWQDEHFVELPEEVEPVIRAHWDSQNRCSNCCVPAISHDIDEKVEAFYLTKRCPYCGAHMDEEVAENV